MTEKTRKILETIAAQNGTTPENVEHEMIEAIRAGMASPEAPRTGVVETNLSRRERTGLGYLSHLYGKPCGYDEGHSRKE